MTSVRGSWRPALVGLGRIVRALLLPPSGQAPLWTDARGSLTRTEFFAAARARPAQLVVCTDDQRESALGLLAALLRCRTVHLVSVRAGAQALRQVLSVARQRRGLGRVYVSTAGSSGTARPVRSRRGLKALGQLIAPVGLLPLPRRPVVVNLAPIDHGHGLVVFLLTLALGGHHHSLDPATAAHRLPELSVDLISGVPAQLASLADALNEPLPRQVGIVLSGSDRLTPELARRLERLLGPVWNAYGATEIGTVCLASPADRAIDPSCVGRPLSGVRIREDSGRLEIGSALGRTLFTGDAGWIGPDGLVRVTGRADGALVSGGEVVAREPLLRFLTAVPGVVDVQLTELSDPRFGTRPAVHLLLGPGTVLDVAALRILVRRELGDAQVPRQITTAPAG